MTKQSPSSSLVVLNPWDALKEFTDARIALGRAGSSVPTKEMLKFQLDHAQARDAVHLPLNSVPLYEQLKSCLENFTQASQLFAGKPLLLNSQAHDRETYLQRPDLGRLLDASSKAMLTIGEYDLAICVVDGLSSVAIEKNATPFLHALFSQLQFSDNALRLAPLTVCLQGRVAIGDDVAQQLNAKVVLVLIGERPGLSSPDSMGVYLTYNAKLGCNDAMRNCISNIRPAGLGYDMAAQKAMYLITQSQRLGLSGVNLKERSVEISSTLTNHQSFLTKQ